MSAQDAIGVDLAKNRTGAFQLSAVRHERIATTRQALARFARAGMLLTILNATRGDSSGSRKLAA